MFRHLLMIVCAAMLFAGPLAADGSTMTAGDITISDMRAGATAQGAMAAAAYLTIRNTGDSAEALIGVAADYPRVMIHETAVSDGVARMEHRARIAIAPGDTVTFRPGGLHVMFMGLGDRPFVAGETVALTLTFETAGAVTLDVPVRAFVAQ